MKKMNVRTLMIIGSSIIVISILIASFVKSWVLFVIFYGGFFPMGVGLVYWTPIFSSMEWFPQRKGLISGLIIGCFGFGALIFGFITKAIVNPLNLGREKAANGEEYFPIEVA